MRNRFFLLPSLSGAVLAMALAGSAAAQTPPPPMPGPMPGQMPPPAGAAGAGPAASSGAPWLKNSEGGTAWQIGALFTLFWVLVAVEIVIISKPANRLDKPKKIVAELD